MLQKSLKLLIEAIKNLGLDNFIFGSVDLGRPELIAYFARTFKTRMVLIDKGREFEETKVLAVVGDVAGKDVIISARINFMNTAFIVYFMVFSRKFATAAGDKLMNPLDGRTFFGKRADVHRLHAQPLFE